MQHRIVSFEGIIPPDRPGESPRALRAMTPEQKDRARSIYKAAKAAMDAAEWEDLNLDAYALTAMRQACARLEAFSLLVSAQPTIGGAK